MLYMMGSSLVTHQGSIYIYLHTSVNWANLSSTAPEYMPTQKIVCQENIDGGKKIVHLNATKHASFVLVAVVKVTCKMAIAPHSDTARASLRIIGGRKVCLSNMVYGDNLVNRRVEDLQT